MNYCTTQSFLASITLLYQAALRMCPALQAIQWQQTSPLSKSISALMVSNCLYLTHLSLSCKVPHAVLPVLGQSKSLQVHSQQNIAYFIHCTFSVRPKILKQGGSVQVLNLQGCRIPSNKLEAWQGFPQLRCLDIYYCTSVFSDNLLLFACGFSTSLKA